jgi:hypothetical protein
MGKTMWAFLILLLIAGAAAGYRFGLGTVDQFIYVGKMIVGWTLWTVILAVLYAGLERLFPNFLCAPHQDS